jgi:hypothetical protein
MLAKARFHHSRNFLNPGFSHSGNLSGGLPEQIGMAQRIASGQHGEALAKPLDFACSLLELQ